MIEFFAFLASEHWRRWKKTETELLQALEIGFVGRGSVEVSWTHDGGKCDQLQSKCRADA